MFIKISLIVIRNKHETKEEKTYEKWEIYHQQSEYSNWVFKLRYVILSAVKWNFMP